MKMFFCFALLLKALVVVPGRTISIDPIGDKDARCSQATTRMICFEPHRNYWRFDEKGCVLVWDNNMCNTVNVHDSKADCEKICVNRP